MATETAQHRPWLAAPHVAGQGQPAKSSPSKGQVKRYTALQCTNRRPQLQLQLQLAGEVDIGSRTACHISAWHGGGMEEACSCCCGMEKDCKRIQVQSRSEPMPRVRCFSITDYLSQHTLTLAEPRTIPPPATFTTASQTHPPAHHVVHTDHEGRQLPGRLQSQG